MMRNIGPVSETWLREIDVHTVDDLTRLGPEFVWLLVRQRHPEASLNLLYALYGAVNDVHWADVPVEIREELKRAVAVNLTPSRPDDERPKTDAG